MTGAELLAQVREEMARRGTGYGLNLCDALDGCVLLTAEEAETVFHVAERSQSGLTHKALALLSPERKP